MPPVFLTDSGLPVPAVTAEQMIELDRIAREETGLNRFQMMESTGRCLAQQALDCIFGPSQSGDVPGGPGLAGSIGPRPRRKIIVLAGRGMNGGGGICAARHLRQQGMEVLLCLSAEDSAADISRWQRYLYEAGGEGLGDRSLTPEGLMGESGAGLVQEAVLLIDALLGCQGQPSPLPSERRLIDWANQSGIPILSLDVPSGMDATQGEAAGPVMRSRWTLTLALPKTGFHPDNTGELILADIGIPAKTYRSKPLGLAYRSPFGRCDLVPLRYQAESDEGAVVAAVAHFPGDVLAGAVYNRPSTAN